MVGARSISLDWRVDEHRSAPTAQSPKLGSNHRKVSIVTRRPTAARRLNSRLPVAGPSHRDGGCACVWEGVIWAPFHDGRRAHGINCGFKKKKKRKKKGLVMLLRPVDDPHTSSAGVVVKFGSRCFNNRHRGAEVEETVRRTVVGNDAPFDSNWAGRRVHHLWCECGRPSTPNRFHPTLSRPR